MKTREGFVSNSSSSSFVLSLRDISEEQKKEIKEIVNNCNEKAEEGWLNLFTGFVFGRVDYHNSQEIESFISRNGFKNKIDYAWGD